MGSLNPFSISRFSKTLSCGTCNDKLDEVTTLNVPALSAFHKVFISLSLSSYYTVLYSLSLSADHKVKFRLLLATLSVDKDSSSFQETSQKLCLM